MVERLRIAYLVFLTGAIVTVLAAFEAMMNMIFLGDSNILEPIIIGILGSFPYFIPTILLVIGMIICKEAIQRIQERIKY